MSNGTFGTVIHKLILLLLMKNEIESLLQVMCTSQVTADNLVRELEPYQMMMKDHNPQQQQPMVA